MTRPLGLAVIGCGFQGNIHAANIADHATTRLIWCADAEIDRARYTARRYGAEATSSVDEVLSDPRVNGVVVATTTKSHAELAVAAAGARKHVLLEKPMALSVADCLLVERAVERAGVSLMVGFKFRFAPAIRAARDSVPHPVVLSAHTLYDPPTEIGWVDDRTLSGGRLISSLVHSVDLLRYLAGAEVSRVRAEGVAVVGQETDTVSATLRFANGVIASLLHGTVAESFPLSVWSFQTAAPGVNATITAHGRRTSIHRADGDDETVIDPTENPFHTGTRELLDAFEQAARNRAQLPPGGMDGTMSLVIACAIEESARTGSVVGVTPPENRHLV